MGQYHTLYNITKKQFVNPHKIDCGLKIWEQIGAPKTTADALFLLVCNSNGRGGGDVDPDPMVGAWAGDKIVVQGDYAMSDDQGFIPPEELESYMDVSDSVGKMLDYVYREQ